MSQFQLRRYIPNQLLKSIERVKHETQLKLSKIGKTPWSWNKKIRQYRWSSLHPLIITNRPIKRSFSHGPPLINKLQILILRDRSRPMINKK